ncbi:MAG: hypothetical protein LBJ90_00745 [Treponema sp.]|jgi:hypothetical protein|nr:hypothetical protein [Treponema sp.]
MNKKKDRLLKSGAVVSKFRVLKQPLLFFKVLISALIMTGTAGLLYAQVNQGELEKNLGPVTFINYEGPHSRIETREQIWNIGASLGREVRAGTARPGYSNRYFVIHSVSGSDGSKLDADIFGLGVDTGVDHIRNLRSIIQGYLETAYAYSARDASLLAEYVTIYNAVYRGDWDYFNERYKNPVMQNLTSDRAGLSMRFDEWPGRTLMIIPLGMGGLSSIDTTAVTDSRVLEEMRKEDDRSVEQRREMVDLKEREAAEAEQKARVEREAIRQEEERITRERAQVQEERGRTAQEQAARDQGQAAQGQDQESERASREEAQRKEQELNRQEEDLDRQERDLDGRRDEARRQEEFAEQKTGEAQEERESIARDQQEALANEALQAAGILGASIEVAGTSLGRIIRLDPSSGGELKRSPLDTVNVRTLTFLSGKIIAIAGENRGNGAIRLIEVNNNNLEMARQGDDDIHPNSLLWVNGSDIYAITNNLDTGVLNLGRFNSDLALQARSEAEIHPYASVIFQENKVLTQDKDGKPVILNPQNLRRE